MYGKKDASQTKCGKLEVGSDVIKDQLRPCYKILTKGRQLRLANRNLITRKWLQEMKEIEELDRNCKIQNKTHIYDAQGQEINVFCTYALSVRHVDRL